MKKIFTFLACLLIAVTLFAQAPEGVVYQAEARNNSGETIANEKLEVEITILEGSINGNVSWEGKHEIITNDFGMFVLVIGTGKNTSGYEFDKINWADQSHFLNVQVKDPATGLWIDMGTTQFLSVPYALHAKTAGSIISDPNSMLKSGSKNSSKAGVPS